MPIYYRVRVDSYSCRPVRPCLVSSFERRSRFVKLLSWKVAADSSSRLRTMLALMPPKVNVK
jgi:hypothetical protein